jgi:hypothetical protein
MSVKKNIVHRRNRRVPDPTVPINLPQPVAQSASGGGLHGPTATITFDQPVILTGLPPITVQGSNVTSALQLSGNTLQITAPGATIGSGTAIVVNQGAQILGLQGGQNRTVSLTASS